MIMDYKEYEKQVELIKKDNKKLLTAFRKELEDKGLSEKTIGNHINNVSVYIDYYLCYYEPAAAQEGCNGYAVSSFLGSFFIRKAMWSSPAQVKSTSVSIKKFYGWMLKATELIDKDSYKDLCDTIKSEMPHWQENSRSYNDSILMDNEIEMLI